MDFKKTLALFVALTLPLTMCFAAKDKVVKDDPEMLLAQIGQMGLKYQDYPQALTAYQKLTNDYPKSKSVKDYTYYLALTLERMNNYQQAAENFQKVVTEYKGIKSEIPGIDSLSMEGVGRCFNKNFKEYAAMINGQPMTKLELDAELEKVPAQYRGQFEGDAGRRKFLDQIIERKLLLAEAQKQGIINNPDVYQRIQDTEQNVLIRGLYDQEVIKKAQPSEKEVKDYYKSKINDYKTPEQVKARQIVVDNFGLAQKIYKELNSKKGLPFDTLVTKYSIAQNAKSGGNVGLIDKNQKPEPDPALFKTAKGKYTKVLQGEPKYAVLKLDKKDGKKLHLKWIVSATEDDAKNIIKELASAPDSFEVIAGKKSLDASKDKNGDMGLVSKDDVAPEIYKAASALKPGKFTTKPVKYFTRYYIYLVEDKIKAGVRDFDQVKAQISGQLQRERQQSLYEGLLKRIKDAAKIEYLEEPAKTEQPEPKPEEKKEVKPEVKTKKPPKPGK